MSVTGAMEQIMMIPHGGYQFRYLLASNAFYLQGPLLYLFLFASTIIHPTLCVMLSWCGYAVVSDQANEYLCLVLHLFLKFIHFTFQNLEDVTME
jgi:hypothetical protein